MEAGKKRLSGDITKEATSDEVLDLNKENARLKEIVADLVLRYDVIKKYRHAGLIDKYRKYMRLSAGEKYEIIQTVTRSEIGVKRTLASFGIARSTFYKWYQNSLKSGFDGLEPSKRSCLRQWNSIPKDQKDLVVEIALEHTELSSKELTYKTTDKQGLFTS